MMPIDSQLQTCVIMVVVFRKHHRRQVQRQHPTSNHRRNLFYKVKARTRARQMPSPPNRCRLSLCKRMLPYSLTILKVPHQSNKQCHHISRNHNRSKVSRLASLSVSLNLRQIRWQEKLLNIRYREHSVRKDTFPFRTDRKFSMSGEPSLSITMSWLKPSLCVIFSNLKALQYFISRTLMHKRLIKNCAPNRIKNKMRGSC